MDIEQMFFGPLGYPGGQGRKVVDGDDFLMLWVDEAPGQSPKVKLAIVRVGMLKGTVVEVKAVYVDTYPGFAIPVKVSHRGGSFEAASLRIGPVDKKNARHTARRGQASIVLAGTL
jgi:hypothetical protein